MTQYNQILRLWRLYHIGYVLMFFAGIALDRLIYNINIWSALIIGATIGGFYAATYLALPLLLTKISKEE